MVHLRLIPLLQLDKEKCQAHQRQGFVTFFLKSAKDRLRQPVTRPQ